PAEPEDQASWLAAVQQRSLSLRDVALGILASEEHLQIALGESDLFGAGGGLGTPPITVTSTADQLFQGPTASRTTVQGTQISLRDAINIANNTPGPDTIALAAFQHYKLDQVDNYWYGPNGLPAISSKITIRGNGATIVRDGGPNFRL